jgi:leader peptidase (prepilin peptidase)/N-methyltransferase
MLSRTFDPNVWAAVPFHFWSIVLFTFGSIVGSFLNVCIHRMPLGLSVVSPPSHCPHCKYSIPWYLNVPLVTWAWLKGQCANCGARISVRYFLVELLTAVTFLACWLHFGRTSAVLALIYAFFLAGLIVATFIDFEHFIIPDEITIGGAVVGFICSFLFPSLHDQDGISAGIQQSLLGIAVGAGLVYGILRLGKLVFGRQRLALPGPTRIYLTETSVRLPDKEYTYEELFYRSSDVIALRAETMELVDRGYKDVLIRLSPDLLRIGGEKLDPATVHHLEAVTSEIVFPREAMGLGDVKFMAAIGAFLGWKAVVFSLMVSSLIGSLVGITLIVLRRQAWSSRLPYGPYIAVAAAVWLFVGRDLVNWWFNR